MAGSSFESWPKSSALRGPSPTNARLFPPQLPFPQVCKFHSNFDTCASPLSKQLVVSSWLLDCSRKDTSQHRVAVAVHRKWVGSHAGSAISTESATLVRIPSVGLPADRQGCVINSSPAVTIALQFSHPPRHHCCIFHFHPPAGDGYAQRLEDAILHGCLPVIIMDHVHVAFETLIDFAPFSIRVPEGQVHNLPSILLQVTYLEIKHMQRALARVWHR